MKPFSPAVVTLSAFLVAPPFLSSALAFPFFGDSRCKDEKARFHNEEQILHDRQQLALHQCTAALEPGHERCQSLKRRHKDEMKLFKDREKNQLDACKNGTKATKTAAKDPKTEKAAKAEKTAKSEKASKKN